MPEDAVTIEGNEVAPNENRFYREAPPPAIANEQAEVLSIIRDMAMNTEVPMKNRENKQTSSNYADLGALANEADPIIHKHGFATSFQPAAGAPEGKERVRWTIAHSAGHVESDVADLAIDDKGPNGSVNKTKLHGFGSTMSYGRRYLKLMLFDVATGDDDDGNKAGVEAITEAQELQLHDLILGADADPTKLLAFYKIKALTELPASKFADAKARLEQMLAVKTAKAKSHA
jgi:hypothetical protein